MYDFDASVDTAVADHGVWNMSATMLYSSLTLYQDSQNNAFDFLATGVAGYIVPPATAYDPDAAGEYTFALNVTDLAGNDIGTSAIRVNVESVPDGGATLLLLATALGAMGLGRRFRG